MSAGTTPLALVYDFDGTLAAGNMQEYEFVPAIGMAKEEFWREVEELSTRHDADGILMYMMHMLDRAKTANVSVRRDDFVRFGRSVELFPGVERWFDRITAYAAERNVVLEHYIVSSGIREMIEGTAIGDKFTKIYASSFVYDQDGVARWPALAVNYTTKTQFLFRINKGTLAVSDSEMINRYVPDAERPVPFSNIVFIGDGPTDVPCFRLMREKGGRAIAVYRPEVHDSRRVADEFLRDGRIDTLAPADYRDGGQLDEIVKRIVDATAAHAELARVAEASNNTANGRQE